MYELPLPPLTQSKKQPHSLQPTNTTKIKLLDGARLFFAGCCCKSEQPRAAVTNGHLLGKER